MSCIEKFFSCVDEEFPLLPVVIGASVGGVVILVVIIVTVIAVCCSCASRKVSESKYQLAIAIVRDGSTKQWSRKMITLPVLLIIEIQQ